MDVAAGRLTTGLAAFQRDRKQGSRDALLAAASELFCANGYFAVPVEDIAATAGVSRMTFYRHFAGKAALAAELYRDAATDAMPRYLAIAERDFRDRSVVTGWIEQLFAADREQRQLLRVFLQVTVEDSAFTERAQALLGELIDRLGERIDAFRVTADRPDQRRQWLEAWLLLYEILDQSNHAALRSGIATDPLVIEILVDRFLRFVSRESPLTLAA